jgi:hypothetical protein
MTAWFFPEAGIPPFAFGIVKLAKSSNVLKDLKGALIPWPSYQMVIEFFPGVMKALFAFGIAKPAKSFNALKELQQFVPLPSQWTATGLFPCMRTALFAFGIVKPGKCSTLLKRSIFPALKTKPFLQMANGYLCRTLLILSISGAPKQDLICHGV